MMPSMLDAVLRNKQRLQSKDKNVLTKRASLFSPDEQAGETTVISEAQKSILPVACKSITKQEEVEQLKQEINVNKQLKCPTFTANENVPNCRRMLIRKEPW